MRVDAICAQPWQGRILDIGSGDGTLAAMVLSRCPAATSIRGVEPDVRQCLESGSHWREWALILDTFWPSTNDVFDGLLCCEVLEHMDATDGAALLARAVRACRPGALVCVTVPSFRGSRAVYPGHIRTFTADDLWTTMGDAGTSDPDLSRIPPKPHEAAIWIMGVAHVR